MLSDRTARALDLLDQGRQAGHAERARYDTREGRPEGARDIRGPIGGRRTVYGEDRKQLRKRRSYGETRDRG